MGTEPAFLVLVTPGSSFAPTSFYFASLTGSQVTVNLYMRVILYGDQDTECSVRVLS